MKNENVFFILKKNKFFNNFSDKDISDFLKITVEKVYRPKDTIINQDEKADASYFIVKGLVKVFRLMTDGTEVGLTVIGPGEIVGEMGLIEDKPRSAFVEAIQETTVLVLSRQSFFTFLKSHPVLIENISQILADRLRITNSLVEDLQTNRLIDRTQKVLEILSKHFNNREIKLTQAEIATLVGASRARVTEVLNILKKRRIIRIEYKKIFLN